MANLFAKLELDYADHPKIMALSDAAFRLHVTLILYSRKYETDGIIKNPVGLRFANQFGFDAFSELENNDENAPSLRKLENGDWVLHGFTEIQETKAKIAERTRRNRENGAKGGRPKKTQSVSESVSEQVSESATKSAPQKKAETETETDIPKSKDLGRPRKRATRIPDGWMPSQELIQAMQQECPGVDQQFEHRKFVDYWTAKSGKDATKADWDATWRNWIRRAAERAPQQQYMSGADRRLFKGYDITQQLAAKPKLEDPFDNYETPKEITP